MLDEAGALIHIEQSLNKDTEDESIVTEETISHVISEWINVTIEKLKSKETDCLMILEEQMSSPSV